MSETVRTSSDRRGLIKGAAIGAVGMGMIAAGLTLPKAAMASLPSSIPGSGDIQVLNYALQLEDLEAELYAQAILRLTTGGTTAQSSSSVGTIPGLNLPATSIDVQYIRRFAPVEVAHRDFLKSALGANAITLLKPSKYDFGIQGMTRAQVIDLVIEAEATGVQAYLGAIPYFTTKSPYLQTAAAIQGTEARHTTVMTLVRNILSSTGQVADPIAPVAPLVNDPGTLPTANSYDPTKPNTGTPEGRDLAIQPDQVLARVGGFIKTA